MLTWTLAVKFERMEWNYLFREAKNIYTFLKIKNKRFPALVNLIIFFLFLFLKKTTTKKQKTCPWHSVLFLKRSSTWGCEPFVSGEPGFQIFTRLRGWIQISIAAFNPKRICWKHKQQNRREFATGPARCLQKGQYRTVVLNNSGATADGLSVCIFCVCIVPDGLKQ